MKEEQTQAALDKRPERDIPSTRAQMQQRIKHRKRARFLKSCKAAGLMLAIIALVAAAGLAVRHFVIEQYFLPEEPAVQTGAEIIQPQPPAEEAPQDPVQTEPARETAPASEPTGGAEPDGAPEDGQTSVQGSEQELGPEEESEPEPKTYAYAQQTDATQQLDLQLYSSSAILIDLETNTVLAEKNADDIIYPASMTKIMTALIACETITDWDATYTMTQDIIDTYFLADATMAGFLAGEEVSMTDLVYGAVLPSGAEATYALADVIAGSEAAFAELMNQKAAELGLTNTHFVDASGLHDDEHYTTVREMAIILQAALDNDLCREVLSTARYTSRPTEQNPQGVEMMNKFLVRTESQELSGAEILAAKTGYTAEAMNCCASYGRTAGGREIICVTAKAWTGDYMLLDHVALYTTYAAD